MTNHQEDESTKIDLDSLQSSIGPPAELEDKIVTRLREQKLIRSYAGRRVIFRWVAAIAACLVFFVAGIIFQRSVLNPAQSGVSMSESTYVLFLMEGPEYSQPKGEQQQLERIAAYRNWAVDLRKSGIPITGTKLHDEQQFLGNVEGSSNRKAIAGYFLIDAASPEKALEIARNCPHLLYGGSIEVRQVHAV
jgi:hypothetical protein